MIAESILEVPLTDDEAAFAATHAGLLRFCATRIHRRYPHEDFDDLVGDGVIGLLRAVRRYDPDGIARFSTYATCAIERAMVKAVNHRARHNRGGKYLALTSVDDWNAGWDLERYLRAGDEVEAGAVDATLIKQAIESLPERWRPVVAAMAGMKSRTEVAHEMGIGVSRVGQLCEQARKAMQEALDR